MAQAHILELLAEAESGSADASVELFDKYGKYVLKAVRYNLSDQLRHLLDSQDLVQSVWASVFENRDNLGTFETPTDLIAFLTTVARRKAAYKARQYLGGLQKSDENRVVRMTAVDPGGAVPDARSSAPASQAEVREEWDRLVGGLSDRNQRILELRRDGHTMAEIASMLEVSERTVQRVMEEVSHRYQNRAVTV